MAEEGALVGLRILVVDDDLISLETVATLLQVNGAQTHTARGVAEAREVVQRHRVDLVISDLAMPAADGYDLIMAIRKLPAGAGRDTPAIAFSATTDPLSRARVMAYGFQAYVPKPVDPARLLSTVTALTHRRTG